MSITFKVQEKAQPGVAGGGVRKHYATIAYEKEVTIDDLTREIEKFSALSEPDIRGVIIALENVIQEKLADGHIIRLEQLGSFYPAISSNGEDDPEHVTPNSIKGVKVNYRAGKRIIQAMEAAGFERA